MRQREWARLIRSLGQLTHRQRQQVMAELAADEGRVKALAIVEESAGIEVSCPHCQGKHVVRNGTADGLQRYKCRCCKATFNALTGTPLARLRMKSKWLGQTGVLRDGVTITEAAERLVAGGRHVWNSGMFLFTARTLLDELQAHAPEVLPPAPPVALPVMTGPSVITFGTSAPTAGGAGYG